MFSVVYHQMRRKKITALSQNKTSVWYCFHCWIVGLPSFSDFSAINLQCCQMVDTTSLWQPQMTNYI